MKKLHKRQWAFQGDDAAFEYQGNNEVAPMAEHWELGVGASYGAASVTKLNIICMGTADHLEIKT